jgi:ComF family protein
MRGPVHSRISEGRFSRHNHLVVEPAAANWYRGLPACSELDTPHMLTGSLQHAASAAARLAQRFWRTSHHLAGLELDLFLPPHCLACQSRLERPDDNIFLCCPCRQRLAPPPGPHCRKCGASLYASAEDCPWCRTHRLQQDAVIHLGAYEGLLREVVLRMKRPGQEALSRVMGSLLMQARGEEIRAYEPQLIVPVPMHWRRWLTRAMNSPVLVGARLAAELGRPVRRPLWRKHNTQPQKELGPLQRFRNLNRAFGLRPGYDLSEARVLLVDDILTTGATANAAARILKKAGAATVVVAVLARAEGPGRQ